MATPLPAPPTYEVTPRPASGGTPLRAALGVGAACVGLALWNPGDDGTPLCPTALLTGLDCPLCGGLRAVGTLGRGDLLRAADHNILVVVAVPLVVLWWVLWWRADRAGREAPRLRVPAAAWIALGVVAVAFTVARNVGRHGFAGWLAADLS